MYIASYISYTMDNLEESYNGSKMLLMKFEVFLFNGAAKKLIKYQ